MHDVEVAALVLIIGSLAEVLSPKQRRAFEAAAAERLDRLAEIIEQARGTAAAARLGEVRAAWNSAAQGAMGAAASRR